MFYRKILAHIIDRILKVLRWVMFSTITGAVLGLVCAFFSYCLRTVIAYREENWFIIAFLPVAGLLIVAFYQALGSQKDQGTNLVLQSINQGDDIPIKMTPLILISTVITHMYGGSAGREGAALQIGGSVGNFLGKFCNLDETDKKTFVMSGMSAAFSALFGTPVAAAIFSIEVVSVGTMQYSALVPCTIASLTANAVALKLGSIPEAFNILNIVDFTFITASKTMVLAGLCAGISIVFCMTLHNVGDFFKTRFKNPYGRIAIGGLIIVVITFVIHSLDYAGTGMEIIAKAVDYGQAKPYAFIFKIIFTAITLGCGFKGGEIVPSFFIGATFGVVVGNLIGMSPSLCAAVGMISVFCGVTNCPISSLLIALELFGMKALPYFLLAVAISYMLSGYYSLYSTQRFMFSKYKAKFIDNKLDD
ncbi:MAG: chloride channel protein [Lachnospirales bacterium]